ncbi:MAG: adenylate kinase [Nitrososphaerota archaeon]
MVGHKIFVVALPGSGKSTVLRKISEQMPDAVVVNFGDLMFSEASRLYGVKHRDEMRRVLGLEEYRRLQVEAAKRIADMEGLVIVDTHAVVKTGFGLYPGLPTDVVRLVKPSIIFFLESRPEDVLVRRMMDERSAAGRVREMETVEEIALDQELSREFVSSAANEAMCYLKIIRLNYPQTRPFQHAEDAAKEMIQTIRSLAHLDH